MDVLVLFLILGLLFLIIGIVYLVHIIIFIQHSKIITGKIIRINQGYSNNIKGYFPIIQYYDYKGKLSSYESNTGYLQSTFKVNDIISLRYIRVNKKSKVCENNTFALFGVSLISIPIGLIFFTIGILGVSGITLEKIFKFFT